MPVNVKLLTKKREGYCRLCNSPLFNCYFKLDSSLNLAGTQATRADMNRLGSTVNNGLNLSDIGFPSSVALSVRVRNIVTKGNALLAYAALCHD